MKGLRVPKEKLVSEIMERISVTYRPESKVYQQVEADLLKAKRGLLDGLWAMILTSTQGQPYKDEELMSVPLKPLKTKPPLKRKSSRKRCHCFRVFMLDSAAHLLENKLKNVDPDVCTIFATDKNVFVVEAWLPEKEILKNKMIRGHYKSVDRRTSDG